MLRATSNARDPRDRRARWHRTLIAALLASALAASATQGKDLAGQPPLTVVTFGGALARSQMRAVIRPYREQSGHWLNVLEHDGGLVEIERQVRTENVLWDVVNLDLPDALRGCRAGLLEKIDPSSLPAAKDGTPARKDFYDAALTECGIGHNVYATVVAYDLDAFDEPPTQIADFFDMRLRRDPMVALEWGLLADGVSREQLYPTLKTRKGQKRAYRALDRIRNNIVWWQAGEEGPALIEQGIVTMSSAWNGRVHGANERGGRIGILWDGQVWNLDVWSIPRGSDRLKAGLRFIRFATGSEVLARQAIEIRYGPTRRSALALIPREVQVELPTAPSRQPDAIRLDYEWWAERGDELQAEFERWLIRRPIYDFHDPDRN
jgi:putative spermidine/putrescine transport system substrate-binding protein